jgi:steroid delta-isomerase-like uncharacterized protein
MTSDLETYADRINLAWNSHDVQKVLSFYSPEYIADDVAQASLLHGVEGLRGMLTKYWRAFPDLQFTVIDTLVQEARLTVVWVAKGTHQGPILNIPPTGHRVEVKGVSVMDVQEGLVVRGQYIWDLAGMLRHLGLLPDLQATERT